MFAEMDPFFSERKSSVNQARYCWWHSARRQLSRTAGPV